MFIGIVVVLFAIWGWLRAIRLAGQVANLQFQLKVARADFNKIDALHTTTNKILTDTIQHMKSARQYSVASSELNMHLLDDAMRQAVRAKAALSAVLRAQGATEEQIQMVLNKTDGED